MSNTNLSEISQLDIPESSKIKVTQPGVSIPRDIILTSQCLHFEHRTSQNAFYAISPELIFAQWV